MTCSPVPPEPVPPAEACRTAIGPLPPSSFHFSPVCPYDSLSRPRRWLRYLPILPDGLRCAHYVRTLLRHDDAPPLPVMLRWLEGRVRPGTWEPSACLAVARYLSGTGPQGPCLRQSLLLFALLHGSRARTVRFVLGIHSDEASATPRSPSAPSPLAHAWIEVNGTPLGDPHRVAEQHRILYDHRIQLAT